MTRELIEAPIRDGKVNAAGDEFVLDGLCAAFCDCAQGAGRIRDGPVREERICLDAEGLSVEEEFD